MKEAIQGYIQQDGTFKNVNVKLAYEVPQTIEYPLVVITEIANSENTRYTNLQGEQATNLSYQIESICQTTELADGTLLDATASAKLLATKISKLLGGQDYKMRRVGDSALRPINVDKTIMRYIERYETCLFENTLYRRY